EDFQNPTPIVIYETPGEFDLNATDFKVAENGANFAVTVEFTAFSDPAQQADPNGRQGGPLTVDYSITPGTATPGADYMPISGTLTFPNTFYNKQTLTIPILNDLLVEPDETLFLTLSNPTGGTIIGSRGTAKLTILDEDQNRNTDTTPPVITGAPDRRA